MPDRVIRDELAKSERYWALCAGPDGEATAEGDTLRLLFRHLLNEADDFGNAEAGPVALSTTMKRPVSTTLAEVWRQKLSTEDLVRPYKVGAKWYVHIPRFRQRLRALKGRHPRPPTEIECSELKDLLSENDGHMPDTRQSAVGQKSDRSLTSARSRAPAESNRIESNRKEEKGIEGAEQIPSSAREPTINPATGLKNLLTSKPKGNGQGPKPIGAIIEQAEPATVPQTSTERREQELRRAELLRQAEAEAAKRAH